MEKLFLLLLALLVSGWLTRTFHKHVSFAVICAQDNMNNLKIPQSQVHSCGYFHAKTTKGRGQVAGLTGFTGVTQ